MKFRQMDSPILFWIMWTSSALAVTSAALLSWLTFSLSETATVAGVENSPSWNPSATELWGYSLITVWATVGASVVAWLSYWAPRRRASNGGVLLIAVLVAVGAIALGYATYLPCGRGMLPVIAPTGWVLELFVGGIESDSPGGPCAAIFSPGFTLARTLGLMATFVGALSAAMALGHRRLDWLVVKHSGDVDVVVGLDAAGLNLVRALVAENARRDEFEGIHLGRIQHDPDQPRIMEQTVGASNQGAKSKNSQVRLGLRKRDLTRLIPRRTRTVVLEPDPNNPFVAEATEAGAIVVRNDPMEASTMRVLCTQPRFRSRRVALRRMYIATESQQTNLEIESVVDQVLSGPASDESEQSGAIRPHRDDVLTRVMVRFDDPRHAKWWHLEQLGARSGGSQSSHNHVVDGFTSDQLIAEAIVERIIRPFEPSRWWAETVFLVGESPLAQTILEEICWQRWRRFEVAESAREVPNLPNGDNPAEPSRALSEAEDRYQATKSPNLARVVLLGAGSVSRVREWDEAKAPWRFPGANGQGPDELQVVAAGGELAAEVEDALAANELGCAVVILTEEPDLRAEGYRLARRLPRASVFVRDSSTVGLDPPVATRAPYRFGPVLTRTVAGETAPSPPRDSLYRLAEQQHATFRKQWPLKIVAPRATGPQKKLASQDWQLLPEFYKEDNVRQHWHLLGWMARDADPAIAWRPYQRIEDGAGEVHTRSDGDGRGAPIAGTIGNGVLTVAEEAGGLSRPSDAILQYEYAGSWHGDAPPPLVRLAESEFERWCDLRERRGWKSVPSPDERHDGYRLHHHLGSWQDLESGDQEYNVELCWRILRRLWAVGLQPQELKSVRRIGEVRAERISQDSVWTSEQGDLLIAQADDWRVTDERGGVRYVSSEAFSDLYTETTTPGVYRRTGHMTARRLEGPESIPTPEGSVLARTGMWVVTSDKQESWPVTEEWFAVGYEQSPHQLAAPSDHTVTSTSSDQPSDDTKPAARE